MECLRWHWLQQTSRPVVGTEIQTSCNFKTNCCDRYCHLDCLHCLFSNTILESHETLWYGIVGTSLCLVISSFSYTKIFLTLRHHQNQVQGHIQQPNQTNQLNIARYKKAVPTAIWLQLTLVACYLPFNIVTVLMSYSGPSLSLCYAWYYTGTFLYLNSSLNPILYC